MSYEDEMRAALANFVVEGRELLQDLETGLLGLEGGGDRGETLNAVFRAAHTIKGSSGLFGLDHIVQFTHVLESVLDAARDGSLEITGELVGALLPCTDHLADLINSVEQGMVAETEPQSARSRELLAAVEPFLLQTSAPPAGAAPEPAAAAADPEGAGGRRQVHLSLRFGEDCLRNGMDPLSFIKFLGTLGEVSTRTTLAQLLPELSAFDPECCYLDFEVTLFTDAPLDAVESVFDFVREDSEIRILDADASPEDFAELVTSAGALAEPIREVLIETGAVSAEALDRALAAVGAPVASPVTGEPVEPVAAVPAPRAAVEVAAVPAAPVAKPAEVTRAGSPAEAGKAAPDSATGGRDAGSIRIDAGRLDRLIDSVGELVIAGASAVLRAANSGDEALVNSLSEVTRLVEEVRDSALNLRMVPIGTTFSRFQRVVRDVSASLGKDINLVISGGDTEVDKALVERIGDPLMHLVRNSIDHGIESAELRAQRGKLERGLLRLNAFHDSGSIVIEVTDDGGGIDTERVLAKAIERGLVDPTAVLSEQEICQLIFEPGFSTAAELSDLSGRGVGMDVVKRNVSALRGTIDVENRPELGCTIRIRLPLTLAIIDGFQVEVGGASFVVPLDRVIECVELRASSESRECMDLRGEVLPFIRLRNLFAVSGDRPRRENVVVVEYAGSKVGLVVDSLIGEFQTVIKPLGPLFEHVSGIGGSTILGNGDVALILDVPMLVRSYGDSQGSHYAHPVAAAAGQQGAVGQTVGVG